ncbi:Aste57867_23889 [Aphanomyces stellatus]|uniref:Aste57867_23889 protein n=1 Tax=Aphanomyces stellatus TaxID=120398 RepID=A0A485LQI8_9STRA|nr:hypothetical protein As57867_023816 [Aphanomyces stellatus]VFU00532.1 Aste57867_23889 [Aphanomyces stellatus]
MPQPWDGGESAREQQRRRQNEYHAALAEQVRTQEAKKRAERAGGGGTEPAGQGGGLFAGLGQNHSVGNKSYARGHHVEKMTAELKRQGAQPQPPQGGGAVAEVLPQYNAPTGEYPPGQHGYTQQQQQASYPDIPQGYNHPGQMQPPPPTTGYHHPTHHQFLPQGQFDAQMPPHQQPMYGEPMANRSNPWQPPGPSDAFHATYPPHQQPHMPQPYQGYAQPAMDDVSHLQPLPPPPHVQTHPSPPPPSHVHQQPPTSSHGRRHAVHPSDGGDRRNAQVEAQAFLKQQMEDKLRRKKEEKRKKDEEERLELQRIEKELKAQAEAYEAEKRSKQKDAIAKQQQLEADLRVKQDEELKKNPKHRHKLHAEGDSTDMPQGGGVVLNTNQMLSPRDQVPPMQWNGPPQQHHPQFQQQNFQQQQTPRDQERAMYGQPQQYEPGPPPFGSPPFGDPGYHPPPFEPPMYAPPPTMHGFVPPRMQHMPSMSKLQAFPLQASLSTGNIFVDERLQMLATELARQRALVEQLVSPPSMGRAMGGGGVTTEDFERLRREMQDELDRRDAQHKQELETWKQRAAALERPPTSDQPNLLQPEQQKKSRLALQASQASQLQGSPPSPQIAFPGATGQYKMGHAPDKTSGSLPSPLRRSSNNNISPQKPFPGATGRYKMHTSPPKSVGPDSNNNDDDEVQRSPQKPFPGANGRYNLQTQAAVGRGSEASPGKPFETRKASPLSKPFPGANGRYQVAQPASSNKKSSSPAKKRVSYPDNNTMDEPPSPPQKPFPGDRGQDNPAKPARREPETKRSASTKHVATVPPPSLHLSSEKPFPGAHGHYNIQAATTKKAPPSPRKTNVPAAPSPRKRAGQPAVSTKPKPFAVVNLLDSSLDGPSDFIRGGVEASLTNLQCESRMIYFNGHVDEPPLDAVHATILEEQETTDDITDEVELKNLSTSVTSQVGLQANCNATTVLASGGSQHATITYTKSTVMTKTPREVLPPPPPYPPPSPSPKARAMSLTAKTRPTRSSIGFVTTPTATASSPPQTTLVDSGIEDEDALVAAAIFRVHVLAPSVFDSERYDNPRTTQPNNALSTESSFDIDDLFEKNTARCQLLERLERREGAPDHVEELVSTFRALQSRKGSTRAATEQDTVHATSKWVNSPVPRWLDK